MAATDRSILSRSCCTTPSALCYWAAVFLVLYGVSLGAQAVVPAARSHGDTLLLAALGAACVMNFRRNRSLHCVMTGPLYLGAATIAAVGAAGVWTVNSAWLWATSSSGPAPRS